MGPMFTSCILYVTHLIRSSSRKVSHALCFKRETGYEHLYWVALWIHSGLFCEFCMWRKPLFRNMNKHLCWIDASFWINVLFPSESYLFWGNYNVKRLSFFFVSAFNRDSQQYLKWSFVCINTSCISLSIYTLSHKMLQIMYVLCVK